MQGLGLIPSQGLRSTCREATTTIKRNAYGKARGEISHLVCNLSKFSQSLGQMDNPLRRDEKHCPGPDPAPEKRCLERYAPDNASDTLLHHCHWTSILPSPLLEINKTKCRDKCNQGLSQEATEWKSFSELGASLAPESLWSCERHLVVFCWNVSRGREK